MNATFVKGSRSDVDSYRRGQDEPRLGRKRNLKSPRVPRGIDCVFGDPMKSAGDLDEDDL
jgi:hypothetical protein